MKTAWIARARRGCARLACCLALAAGVAVALPRAAGAAEPPAHEWHYELWNGLMSPFCPGRTLLDCPSPQAAELRQWIADQEAAGRRRQDVEAELYAQFGDVILQAPKAQGFGLAAYVVPALGVAAGAAFVAVFLRRQAAAARRRVAPVGPAPDPDLDRIIDEEMKRG